jgi:hypothetical protein
MRTSQWPVGIALACSAAVTIGGMVTTEVSAHADSPLAGQYTVVTAHGGPSTWTITSACTPVCVASIVSSRGWQGYATLTDNSWTMSVYLGHGPHSSYPVDPATCPSSPIGDLVQHWTWDSQSLTGSVETVRGDQCGGPTTVDIADIALEPTTRQSRMDPN